MQTELDPRLKTYLKTLETSGRPLLHTLAPVTARTAYREGRQFAVADPEPVALVINKNIPGPHGPIPLRIYRPDVFKFDASAPALIYFHGGGWTIGDIETHDSLCRQYANQTPCVVVAVDYRLAPEFSCPVPVEEGLAVIDWLAKESSLLGIDPERLAVGGDSAGGNISAVICLELRDRGGIKLVHQMLIYPATDQNMAFDSHQSRGQGFFLTNELMFYFRNNYLPAQNFDDWRASPLKAVRFTELPPATIITAGFDPLLDEGYAYAQELKKSGVPTVYKCFEDQIHGFINLGKVTTKAREAIQFTASELHKAFTL